MTEEHTFRLTPRTVPLNPCTFVFRKHGGCEATIHSSTDFELKLSDDASDGAIVHEIQHLVDLVFIPCLSRLGELLVFAHNSDEEESESDLQFRIDLMEARAILAETLFWEARCFLGREPIEEKENGDSNGK